MQYSVWGYKVRPAPALYDEANICEGFKMTIFRPPLLIPPPETPLVPQGSKEMYSGLLSSYSARDV